MNDKPILKYDPSLSTNLKFIWSVGDINLDELNNNNNNGLIESDYYRTQQQQQQQQQQPDKTARQRINSSFHPELSHSVFKEPQILGYEPLRLNVFFGAGSLTTLIDTNYTIKSKNITNVEKQLTMVMSKTDPPLTNMDEFVNYIETMEDKFKPPGMKIHEYTVIDKNNGEELMFEVYFGRITDPAVLRYHERLQVFCLWFIDAASFIFSEDGNWDVFFVFEKRLVDGVTRYGIAGYCTVYNFYHHPSCTRPRISQFLVLPTYQRMSNGKHLLNSIYNQYKTNDSVYGPVYDVTVEDPGELFVMLRNTTDLDNIMKLGLFKNVRTDISINNRNETKDLVETVRKQLLLSPQQTKTCLEIYILSKLINLPDSNPIYRNYRIAIKKKLYKQCIGDDVKEGEDKPTDPTKIKEIEETKKSAIIQMYKQMEQDYCQTIYALDLMNRSNQQQ